MTVDDELKRIHQPLPERLCLDINQHLETTAGELSVAIGSIRNDTVARAEEVRLSQERELTQRLNTAVAEAEARLTAAVVEADERGRLAGLELGKREGVELGRTHGIELGKVQGMELGTQ